MPTVPDRALYNDNALAPGEWNLAKTVFETTTIDQFMAPTGLFDVIQKKPFTGAKNEEFVCTADDGVTEAHDPGGVIVGQAIEKNNRIISLEDRQEVIGYDVSDLDKFIAHYDHQSKAGINCGRAHRRTVENQAYRLAFAAANAAAAGAFKGGQLVTETVATSIAGTYPLSLTGSKKFVANIAAMQRLFHNDQIPEEMETYVFCGKWMHDVLRQDVSLQSRDYSDLAFADRLRAKLLMVENAWIMPSFYIPTARQEATASASVDANYTTETRTINGVAAYAQDCRKLVAIVLRIGPASLGPDGEQTSITSGLGCLMAQGISTAVERMPGTLSTKIHAAMLKGMGILRPELVGAIVTS